MSAPSLCSSDSLLLTLLFTIDNMNTEREEHCYYIKLDNILSKDPTLNRYHLIKATSGPDLFQKAIALYGFKKSEKLQIWSSIPQWLQPSLRIDTLDIIPEGHEFLWLRAQSSSS